MALGIGSIVINSGPTGNGGVPQHTHVGASITTPAVSTVGLADGDNVIFYPVRDSIYNQRPIYRGEPNLTLWYDLDSECWNISEGQPFISPEKIIASSDPDGALFPYLSVWVNDVTMATLDEVVTDLPQTFATVNALQQYSATSAQGVKADTALQPVAVNYAGEYNNGIGYGPDVVVLWNGALYKKISNFSNPGYPPSGADWELFEPEIGSPAYDLWAQTALNGKAELAHGHFQPNPQYAADSAANAQASGFDGQPTAIFSRVNVDFYQGDNIEYYISRNGQSDGGVAGSWNLYYQPSDAAGGNRALSTTATAYPWEATWTNGVTVVKAALPRIIAPLAATASEGTSTYAARADHAHSFPTAAQVGAAPAGNYATLDGTGKIPSTQLPSYVDDVVEYATLSALQADTTAQVSGKIYVTRDTGKIYRWSGYSFIEISNTLELANLQIPDNFVGVFLNINDAPSGTLSKEAALVNGKNSYSASGDNEGWQVFYDETRWKGQWSYSGDGDTSAVSFAAAGNEQYPWQATWTNASVTRIGTYNAALAPAPLAAAAYSGVGTKAAREDHVHPLPTVYSLEIHVSKDGNDTTGNGTLLNPVLTITKALTLVGAGKNTVIVHPGGYTESPTVTSTNTTIATSELTGANTFLTGTLTLSAAARISGLKMSNLTITGSGNTYISNCTVDTRVIKSGSNYVEIINSELQCTSGVQITGAGTVSIVGNKCWSVAVSNAAASVLIKDCFQVITPSVTAGSLQFDGCAIFAAAPTTNAVTSSAGTNITLANSFVLNSAANSVERVSLGGNYSILNLVYDKANSTLTGTNLNAVDYFSVINAEKIGVNTAADATVGLKLDSTGVKFNDGTIQTTAATGITTGAVDNAILRADGTGGATLQNSGLIVEDTIVSFAVTGVAATDIITATGSAFANGQPVRFTALTGGAGLVTTTNYYVINVSGATFQVSTSVGGGASLFTTDITVGTLVNGHSVSTNVTLSENTTATNSDLVLTPKGTGAFIVGANPDGTVTGGNARGIYGIDICPLKTTETNVASGSYSVNIGTWSTSSGLSSVAIGRSNSASTDFTIAIGSGLNASADSSTAIGRSNTANAASSTAIGRSNTANAALSSCLGGSQGLANRYGMHSHAAGSFAAQGDAQRARFVLRCKTTTNTAVEMALDGATTRLTIPSGKYLTGTINIAGIKSDGSATASYIRQFSIKNVAATTTLVGTVNTIGIDTVSLTSISITANDASDFLSVQVTGILSETWRWVASVDVVEVAYGA